MASAAETLLKGVWYFDRQDSSFKQNLANPYNTQPEIELGLALESQDPLWNSSLNRWTFGNGRKIILRPKTFLDYRSTELLRGISIAIDFRWISSDLTNDDILIGKLESNFIIGIFFHPVNKEFSLKIKIDQGSG